LLRRRGEVFVRSEHADTVISEKIGVGDHFGEMALVNGYVTQSTALAGLVICELLFLSRARFKHTCRMHMSDAEYNRVSAPNLIAQDSAESAGSGGSPNQGSPSVGFVRNQRVLRSGEWSATTIGH
jgi:hypothetical protein